MVVTKGNSGGSLGSRGDGEQAMAQLRGAVPGEHMPAPMVSDTSKGKQAKPKASAGAMPADMAACMDSGQSRGGKPSPGTKKDGRLTGNPKQKGKTGGTKSK